MGTNCAPLVADLCLFCYERETSCCLFQRITNLVLLKLSILLLVICMANNIYPSEHQLNKANVSDTEASFLDLHVSISDGFVKTKIYDKRDDFDFDIVNFPFLDDIPRSTSYGVYISQLIRFARVSSLLELKDKYSCLLGVIILLCNSPVALLFRQWKYSIAHK